MFVTADLFHRLAGAIPWVAVGGGVALALAWLFRRTGTSKQRQLSLELLLCLLVGFGWLMAMRQFPLVEVRSGIADFGWLGFLWVWGAVACAAVVMVRAVGADRGQRRGVGGDGTDVWVSVRAGSSAWVVGSRIVVTEGFLSELGVADQAHVLRHEVAHVRAFHWWRALGVALLACLVWWHPAAWLLAREASTEREIEADKAAAGLDRAGYASAILALARGGEGLAVFGGGVCARRWEALRLGDGGRWSPIQVLTLIGAIVAMSPLLHFPAYNLIFVSRAQAADGLEEESKMIVLQVETRKSVD